MTKLQSPEISSAPEKDPPATRLMALFRISQILAAGNPQQESLAEMLDVMDEELKLRRGTIMLLNQDASELTTLFRPISSR